MGFKPRSFLKLYHHVRPSQFLYPDEKVNIEIADNNIQYCLACGRVVFINARASRN